MSLVSYSNNDDAVLVNWPYNAANRTRDVRFLIDHLKMTSQFNRPYFALEQALKLQYFSDDLQPSDANTTVLLITDGYSQVFYFKILYNVCVIIKHIVMYATLYLKNRRALYMTF